MVQNTLAQKTLRFATLAALGLSTAASARALGEDSILRDVVYHRRDGMALTMDVLKPVKANGAGIIHIVSGSWVSRWTPPETFARGVRHFLDAGFTVFVVRHPWGDAYPVPRIVPDVLLAVRFIRLEAKTFGVDPDRLGAHGSSAGGHLALMVATTGDDGNPRARTPIERTSSRVAAVATVAPIVDLRPLVQSPSDNVDPRYFKALVFDPFKADSVSPVLQVTPDDAPTLIVHGEKDTMVPVQASRDMYAALQQAKVVARLVTLPAGHGIAEGVHREVDEAVVQWFRRHLTRNKGA